MRMFGEGYHRLATGTATTFAFSPAFAFPTTFAFSSTFRPIGVEKALARVEFLADRALRYVFVYGFVCFALETAPFSAVLSTSSALSMGRAAPFSAS